MASLFNIVVCPSFRKSKSLAIPGFIIKYATKWLPHRGK
jgi:hypothetical protein